MNKINPKKLPNSKWTAQEPINREKHFLITEVEFDEQGVVVSCIIQAVLTGRAMPINWHELQDRNHWGQGWQ